MMVRAGGSAPTDSDAPRDRRGWLTLAHGAMILLALAFLRVEKAVYLKLELGPAGWTALLLPEIGFALAMAALGFLLARRRARPAAVAWWALFPPLLVAIYAVALADHLFFLHTGTRLHLELVSYAAGNLKMLSGVLGSGVDAALWWRTALIACCLALASIWGWRQRSPLPDRGSTATAAAAAGLGIVLASGALAPVPARAHALARSALPEFLSGVVRGVGHLPGDLPEPIPADELFRPPEVVGGVGPQAPDVVILILESTRADSVPPYAPAERRGESPALADVAERAVVFDDVYTSVTHTSKALIGLLCGMYPRLEMPIIETLDGNLPLPCLPALLARAGYRTAFLQSASGRFENRPGLVRNLGFEHGAFLETLERDGRFARTGYFGLDEFAMLEPAVSWAAGGGEEPYLLTVLTVTPHHPYEVPGERGAWRGESLAQYRAAIRHQDRFLGALLGALGARGALDDAVVFVVGDHGEAFGEHGRLQHDAVPYEEVVKVPLLVLGPESRVGPPRRIGGLRHHVDLMPTVFRLAGIEWRGRLPGEDLFSGDGHARVIASCWYSDYCLAMREGDRKTVFHFWRRPTQVFDLGGDPGELVDLASSLEAREVRAAERSMLAFKRSIDAFYAEHPIVEGPPLWWNQSVD